MPATLHDYLAPRRHPLLYPGRRPPDAFVLRDATIHPWTDGVDVHDRIGIIAYGSNLCPGQLYDKLRWHAPLVVPVQYGWLQDAQVVLNLISNHGYAFADLMVSPGARAWIGVTWLDRAQLRIMNATEANYHPIPCPLPCTVDGVGVPEQTLYLYAGRRPIWIPPGRQQPLEMTAHTQAQALQQVIDAFALPFSQPADLAAAIVQEFRRDGESTWKRTLQAAVADGPHLPPSLTQLATYAGVSAQALIASGVPIRD